MRVSRAGAPDVGKRPPALMKRGLTADFKPLRQGGQLLVPRPEDGAGRDLAHRGIRDSQGFIPDDWLHRLDHCTHEIVVETLPANHRDPFDRILVAQSLTETLRRMTHDATVACDRDTIVLI